MGAVRFAREAEDLVQETFARVLAKPRRIRNEDDIGYLLQVLRNTFISSRRAAPRRLAPEALDDRFEPVDPRAGSRPAQAAEAREVFAVIAGSQSVPRRPRRGRRGRPQLRGGGRAPRYQGGDDHLEAVSGAGAGRPRDEIVLAGGRRKRVEADHCQRERHPAHRRGARARARGRGADLGRGGRRSRSAAAARGDRARARACHPRARAPFWRRHRWGHVAAAGAAAAALAVVVIALQTGSTTEPSFTSVYEAATLPDGGRAAVARR